MTTRDGELDPQIALVVPPSSGDVTREVFRRARAQGDLEAPLVVTAAELAALRKFGVETRDEGPAFFIGTAPGWQLYELAPEAA